MEKSSSVGARALAAAALICGFLVLFVVVVATLSDGDSGGNGGTPSNARKTSGESRPKEKAPAFYVVEVGDTLTSIARETGVSVARIQDLNPEVDPQVLVSGEKLKLR
jgi:LysM repeat protein